MIHNLINSKFCCRVERGRRGAVSLGGPRQTPTPLLSPQELLPRVPEAGQEKEGDSKSYGEENEKQVSEERKKKDLEEDGEHEKQYTVLMLAFFFCFFSSARRIVKQ